MPFCADSWYIWQCRYFSDLAPRHRNPSQQINALPVSFISVWCSCRYVSVLFSLPAFKVHYVRLEGGSRIINLLVSGHVGAPPCIYGEVLPNLLWPYHSGPDHPGFVLLQFVAKGDTHGGLKFWCGNENRTVSHAKPKHLYGDRCHFFCAMSNDIMPPLWNYVERSACNLRRRR
jgi:hypothetical protein